jgi:hypothetical protein
MYAHDLRPPEPTPYRSRLLRMTFTDQWLNSRARSYRCALELSSSLPANPHDGHAERLKTH